MGIKYRNKKLNIIMTSLNLTQTHTSYKILLLSQLTLNI